MIPAGTDLKYRVDIDIEGFDPKIDDFSVDVKNRWCQVKYSIGRADMLTDTDGNRYIALKSVPAGSYIAVLTASLKDTDFEDGRQNLVFVNHLADVGCCPRHDGGCSGGGEGGTVTYTRVFTVNLDNGTYIYDADGNPIEDVNGNRVRLSMTSEEVKELLEGRNENGTIDTIPEVIDAVSGLRENTEYTVMSNDDVDSMMSRVFGNDNDN